MGYVDQLKAMSDEQLAEAIAGWREGTVQHWLVRREMQRRDDRWPAIRSWLALAISAGAFVLAFFKQ